MRTFFLLITCVIASFAFVGCSNDDDVAQGVQGKGVDTQVLVLFSPYQIGDLGYSDNVFKGIMDFKNSLRDTSILDVSYISCETDSATLKALKKWAENPRNLLDDAQTYSRRLLVLTTEWQLDYLDSISLGDNDEVLILDCPTDVTDSLSTARFGNRVHALNISAAKSVARLLDVIHGGGAYRDEDKDSSILYYPTLTSFEHVDSIYEVLRSEESYKIKLSLHMASVRNYGANIMKYLTSLAYEDAMVFSERTDYDKYNRYAIVNYRSANVGFRYYMVKEILHMYSATIVDASDNTNMSHAFYISRKFGMALQKWIWQWYQTTMGGMPKLQWHGEWDGYCVDNIEFFGDDV